MSEMYKISFDENFGDEDGSDTEEEFSIPPEDKPFVSNITATLMASSAGPKVDPGITVASASASAEWCEDRRPPDTFGNPTIPTVTADAFENSWRDDATKMMRRRFWNKGWYDWTGPHWVEREENAVRGDLYRTLKVQQFTKRNAEGDITILDWNPTSRSVSSVMDAFTGTDVFTPNTVPMPSWFSTDGGEQQASRLVSLQNGLLDLDTKELRPHTPQYFNRYSLPFEYDPDAECKVWTSYLNSIFINDPDTIALLQEWAGYVLSGRTDLQKMMFLVGPPRSGKGTFSGIMERLVGEGNYAGPTIDSISTNFGLESLIDKQIATFDDVRFDPRSNNYSTAIERLLSITGAGTLTVDRKNKPVWVGKIPARLMMLSNVVPELEDTGGALPNRFLVAVYTRSFAGQEDHDLLDKLSDDLTGIFNWALQGLDRLNRNGGKFTQPQASAATKQELKDNANEIYPFVREHCQLGEEQWVWADELYNVWAMIHGGFKDDAKQRRRFGKLLKAGFPDIEKKQKRYDGSPRYYYQGITTNFGITTE
jgi:putative DNA primase/helicase